MKPIGLVLPLTRGNNGYFDQSYDTMTQIKSNIINLLRTNSGERRMQPQFSSGLQEALFEQNLQNTPDLIKRIIENKILRSFDDEKFEYFYILLSILIIFEIDIFIKVQFAIFIFNHFKSQSRLMEIYS